MHRLVRVLVLWVLAIAMPLQGLAASAMLSCGSGPAQAPEEWHHGPHADPGPAPHGLGEHALAAVPSHGASHDASAPVDPDTHSCSACAACCVGLALPARSVPPPPCGPAQAVPAPAVAPVSAHAPDGLDRPPRTALA